MTDQSGRTAMMFNRGADDRLRGEPEWTGRARYATEDLRWWLFGWHDVDRYYASRVRGRWRYTALPPVREEIPA